MSAPVGRWVVVLVAAALATACATAPRPTPGESRALREAQQARERELRGWERWGFEGRVVVVEDGRTGSGRIDWRREGGALAITFSAPVSRSSWRLEVDAGGARLEGLEDGPRHASDAESLLLDSVGWSVPLASIEAWARGARAPGPADLEFGADGLPAGLGQGGWTVRFRDWYGDRTPPLPRRVFAERGQTRFRLVVDRWTGEAAAPAGAGDALP